MHGKQQVDGAIEQRHATVGVGHHPGDCGMPAGGVLGGRR